MVTRREFNRIKKQNPESRIWKRTRKEQKLRNELAKILMKAREEWIDTTADEYAKKLLKLEKEKQEKIDDIAKLEEKIWDTEKELEWKEQELWRIKWEIGKLKLKESELNDKEKELIGKEKGIRKKEETLKGKETILSSKEIRIKSKLNELGISESEFSEDWQKELEELMMEELLEFRENRKLNVTGISDKIKERIIESASKVDVKFWLTNEWIKKITIKLIREWPYYGAWEREYTFYDPTYQIWWEMGYKDHGHKEINSADEIESFLTDLSILIHRWNEYNVNDNLAFAMYLTWINWWCRVSKIYEKDMNHYKYRAESAESRASYYPEHECY